MDEYKEPPPPYSPEAPKSNQPLGHQGMQGYQGGVHPFPQEMPTPNSIHGAQHPIGYQAVPSSSVPNYGSTVFVNHQVPVVSQVILVGGCPACKVGVLENDFTCLGILLAILFFPIGILCCLALQSRRCSNCGVVFG